VKRSCAAAAAGALLACTSPAAAQRADANAVTDAADAFGFSKAGDAVGLYTSGSVRGFSPSRAGNLRMEGLYRDSQAYFTLDLIDHSRIHVGLTALGFPFPAPSGLVDSGLKPSGKDVTAISVTGGPDAGRYVFLDVARAGAVSFAGGASLNHDHYPLGGGSDYLGLGGVVRGGVGSLKLTAFGNTEVYRRTRYDPTFYVAGPQLPGRTGDYDRLGQTWAGGHGHYDNAGVLANLAIAPDLALRAGLFRSVWTSSRDYDQVFDGVADGAGQLTVYAYPQRRFGSWSGEARLVRDQDLGSAHLRTILAVRGRAVDRRHGGEAAVELGRIDLQADARRPKPALAFTAQSRDSIDQLFGGAQAQLTLPRLGQLSGGVERVRYEKTFRASAGPATRGVSEAWLYNASAAWRVHPRVTLFAAASRGLEDTGAAPASAVNRGEVLPAILSTQREAGFRIEGPKSLALTGAVFRLEKPYPGFAPDGRYRLAGDLVNKGAEVSLSASPAKGLRVLAGLYLAKPELDGGRPPLGSFRRQAQLYLSYAPPNLAGASFDLRVAHQGGAVVRPDLRTGERTTVDIGARWATEIDSRPLSFRVTAANLFDADGFVADASGGLTRPLGRTLSLTATRDF